MTRQSDLEQRNPDDPLAALEREAVGDALMAQRELIELEQYGLRRWLFAQPASGRVVLGAAPGVGAEATIAGDQRDPFGGVAVLNTSGIAVAIGFEAGAAIGMPLFTVPAHSWLQLPVRYVNLSLGVANVADATGPAATLSYVRLRTPPLGVNAGPFGA